MPTSASTQTLRVRFDGGHASYHLNLRMVDILTRAFGSSYRLSVSLLIGIYGMSMVLVCSTRDRRGLTPPLRFQQLMNDAFSTSSRWQTMC